MRDANWVAKEIVDSAVAVHRALGPGLLERIYQQALRHELEMRGLVVVPQLELHATYPGFDLGAAYRCDLAVEGCVVVEIKATETLSQVHRRQTLTYLKLSGYPLALLLNFGGPLMRDGIVRLAN